MIVTRTFESITKNVECCGECPWLEHVPEPGCGNLPICMHPNHPGKGGYDGIVKIDKIDDRCPLK